MGISGLRRRHVRILAANRRRLPTKSYGFWSPCAIAVLAGSCGAFVPLVATHQVQARNTSFHVSNGIALLAFREATPQAITTSVTPEECRVAPRPVEDFTGIVTAGTAAAPPAAGWTGATSAGPSQGDPADAVTEDGIRDAVAELIGCANAGDLRRASALYTEGYFRRFFGGLEEQALEGVFATPIPLPSKLRVTSVTIEQVRLLDDDRVGAVVRTGDAANFLIFAKAGQRCLLDDSVELVTGVATPRP